MVLTLGQERALLRRQKMAERAMLVEKCLKEEFPTRYTVAHSSLFITLGLVGAVLQFATLLNVHSNNYEMGQGVWAGFVCILVGLSTLIFGMN
jgi:hypothetical protein